MGKFASTREKLDFARLILLAASMVDLVLIGSSIITYLDRKILNFEATISSRGKGITHANRINLRRKDIELRDVDSRSKL